MVDTVIESDLTLEELEMCGRNSPASAKDDDRGVEISQSRERLVGNTIPKSA